MPVLQTTDSSDAGLDAEPSSPDGGTSQATDGGSHRPSGKDQLQDQCNAASDSFHNSSPSGVTDCCAQTIEPAGTLPDTPPPAKQDDEEYQPGLIIRGSEHYRNTVKSQLDAIKKTKCGAQLLNQLAAAAKKGRKVRIVETDGGSTTHLFNKPAAYKKGKKFVYREQDQPKCVQSLRGTGEGSDSEISYNQTITNLNSQRPGNWTERPPAIGLAHELVHAMLGANGAYDPGFKDGVFNTERQAVGLKPFDKDPTENCIRRQWRSADYPQGIPLRPMYGNENPGSNEIPFIDE